jgi:MFS family permease
MAPWFWLAVSLLALSAMANVGAIVGSMTLFQEIEDRADKGRVIAVRTGLGQLSATIGLLLGGVLGELLGVRTLFLYGGVAAAVLAIAVYLPYRLTGPPARSLPQADGAPPKGAPSKPSQAESAATP